MDLNNLNLPPERRKALEQVLDQAWKDYQDDLTNLTDAAADEIETVLERDPLNARETVCEYTATANRLADDYYATVRTAWAEYAGVTMPDFDPGTDLEPERVLWQVQGGFANTDYNGLTYSQVMAGRARSGATIDDLWPSFSNIDDAQQFITDMIRTGARLTERRNIRLDPTKPKWARVPKGPKTCAFCAMLASRGYAYTSEEAAGGKGNIYHTDCHCQPMPNWGKQALTGYDPDKFKAMYDRAKELSAENDGSTDTRKVLSWMRSEFPSMLKDGVVFAPDMRVPRGCDLERQLGPLHTLRVNQLLKKSGHAGTARLWSKYAGEYRIAETYSTDNYYSPSDKAMHLDLKRVLIGDKAHRPYQNLFHESGHMLDHLLGGDTYYSTRKNTNGERLAISLWAESVNLKRKTKAELQKNHLEDINRAEELLDYLNLHHRLKADDLKWMLKKGIIKDVNAAKGSGHTYALRQLLEYYRDGLEPTDSEVLAAIASKVRANASETDLNIEDMLQAALGDNYPRKIGHADGYFANNFNGRSSEAWAEMIDAQLANPKAYALIKQYFPESAKLFDEMVKEAMA